MDIIADLCLAPRVIRVSKISPKNLIDGHTFTQGEDSENCQENIGNFLVNLGHSNLYFYDILNKTSAYAQTVK